MKKIVLLLFLAVGMMAQAQMIGATNSQRTPRTDNSPVYYPTGPSLRFGVGVPMVVSIAYNYQLKPWLMFGGGLGYGFCGMNHSHTDYKSDYYSYTWYTWNSIEDKNVKGDWCMPLFVEAEVRTPRYKWSLFLNVKLAFNLFAPKDYYYNGLNYNTPDYNSLNYTEVCSVDYHAVDFYTMAGVSYKNINFGVGYSTVNEVNITLSYNLPFTTIKKRFF